MLDRARALLERVASIRDRLPGGISRAAAAGPDGVSTIVAAPEDDLSSITGRIDTASDTIVALVVPRSARRLRDPGIWPHIAAHARRRGIWLGVVSKRSSVRSAAADNGLLADTSVQRLLRPRVYRLHLGARTFVLPRVPWARFGRMALLAIVIAGALLGACYTVPSAEIVLVPPSEPFRVQARVQLSAQADEPDLGRGLIPARTVRRQVRTVVSTIATGEAEVGDRPATVELEFTNDSDAAIVIVAGSLVTDESGVPFRTDRDLDVAAGTAERVLATADVRGEIGNVAASVLRIGDALPAGVTVTNPSRASGGTNEFVPAVALADVDRVREIAGQVLRRIAEREIVDLVEGGTVFPETLTVAIFSEEPIVEPGAVSEAFMMEYTIILTALFLPDADATAFGELLLRGALGDGQALLPGSTTTQVISGQTSTIESGGVAVDLEAVGRVIPAIDIAPLAAELAGLTSGEAAEHLRTELRLEEEPRITLKPEFIPWWELPRRADRITIRLVTSSADEADDAAGDDADDDDTSDDDATDADGGGAT